MQRLVSGNIFTCRKHSVAQTLKRFLVTKSTRKGVLRCKPPKHIEKPNWRKNSFKEFTVDWKRFLQWLPSNSFDKQTQFILSLLSSVKPTTSVADGMYLLDSFTRNSNRERLEREKRAALYQKVIEDLERYDAYCTAVDKEISSATTLVFSGGGVLGNAYVGALSVLEKHGLDYNKVTKLAGTSAGALTGSCIVLVMLTCHNPFP